VEKFNNFVEVAPEQVSQPEETKEVTGEKVEALGHDPEVLKSVVEIPEAEINELIERAKKLEMFGTPLVAVHATDHFPGGGVIRPGGTAQELAGRNTIHFSFNGVATASFVGSSKEWSEKKYFIAVPLVDLAELNESKVLGGSAADFFFFGETALPSTVKVFDNQKALEEFINKVSRVRVVGNRTWSGYQDEDDRKFMEKQGWFTGLHQGHWTGQYENLRYRGSDQGETISHEEALKMILIGSAYSVENSPYEDVKKENLDDLNTVKKQLINSGESLKISREDVLAYLRQGQNEDPSEELVTRITETANLNLSSDAKRL